MAHGEAATRIKVSSQLEFHHTRNEEISLFMLPAPCGDAQACFQDSRLQSVLAAPSTARAQHPPEQPQAQTDLQHSHAAASCSLTDAMKIKGKVANSDSPGWKTRDFLVWLKVP